jgi:hypothetical protein
VGFKKRLQVLFLLLSVVSGYGPISVPHEASKVRISLATLPLQVPIVRPLPMRLGGISRGVAALADEASNISKS